MSHGSEWKVYKGLASVKSVKELSKRNQAMKGDDRQAATDPLLIQGTQLYLGAHHDARTSCFTNLGTVNAPRGAARVPDFRVAEELTTFSC